jgi:hypothetical protein
MFNSPLTEIHPGAVPEHEMLMEVFTAYHRITGKTLTSSYRTNGVMNNEHPYLLLEKVITYGLLRGNDNGIESRYARINKSDIIMAVPNEEIQNERLARPTRLSGFLLLKRVLLGMDNFEVSGNLHLEQEVEIEKMLNNRQETFIGVTDATIVYLPNPYLKLTANTVLINKNSVQFICAGAP